MTRLLELMPQLTMLKPETDGCSLVLVAPDAALIAEVKRDRDLILGWTAIVLGVDSFKLLQNDEIVYFASLQSLEEYQKLGAMLTTTLEKETDSTITQEPKQEKTFVPWDLIATAIGKTEEQFRQLSAEKYIPIVWMNGGRSWGIEEKDSDRLITEYYEAQKEQAISRVREKLVSKSEPDVNMNGSSATTVAATPPAKSKKTAKRIKLQKEFRPANGKNLFMTIERYLDAASDNPEEQVEIINEVVKDSAIGNKHLDKIMTSYTGEMRKPTRFGLQTAFKNYKTKKLKGDSEPTKVDGAETVEAQSEAVAEEG
ncbi:hypothetical protein [Scytonema hofmannii]|nr:hypothetical protein [Scytonema hofmannii]